MKGFFACNRGSKLKNNNLVPMSLEEINERNNMFFKAGFIADTDNNCFVVKDYGAYMGNVDSNNEKWIKDDYFSKFIDEGYELVIGPKSPNCLLDNHVGVFCSNYVEILNKNKSKSKIKSLFL